MFSDNELLSANAAAESAIAVTHLDCSMFISPGTMNSC